MDAFVGGAEHIAEHTDDAAFLFENECRGGGFLSFSHGFLPASEKGFELMVEFAYAFTLGRGAYDDPEVFWADTLYELAQAQFLFCGLDLLGY